MDLSSVAWQLPQSSTLAMNELVSELRAQGEEIFNLGFGESPFPVHPRIAKALMDNAWRRNYTPTQGIPALREQVSIFYQTMFGLNICPEQIVVGPGSKALLFAALAALDGPLFLPAPSWVSYQQMGRFLNKDVYHIPTDFDEAYRLTPNALEDALKRAQISDMQQKILVLNYPCNPTGQTYSKWQLRELSLVAREHNIVIVSDEIYALTSYHNQRHHSIAEYYPEGTLIIGGPSKDRSLGGYRLGVLLIPEDGLRVLKSIIGIGSEIWSCVSVPLQYAAIEAYAADKEIVNYIRRCTMIHESVTGYAYNLIQNANIDCPPPQGAFYLFPNWNRYREPLKRKGVSTSEDLSEHLLRNWKVASLPGSFFGMSESSLNLRLATVDYDGVSALEYFEEESKTAFSNPEKFVSKIAPRVVEACNQLVKFTAESNMQIIPTAERI